MKRDLTSKNLFDWYLITYGLKKDGNLALYKYGKKYSTTTEEQESTRIKENQAISDKIINDGIKNTFAFFPVIVYNEVNMIEKNLAEFTTKMEQTSDTSAIVHYQNEINALKSSNIRQAICQIDKNNFVFITDRYIESLRYTGFNYVDLAKTMLGLGCKHGFGLDGGGSNALVYKASSGNSVIEITNGGRHVADIIYFQE